MQIAQFVKFEILRRSKKPFNLHVWKFIQIYSKDATKSRICQNITLNFDIRVFPRAN